MKFEDIVQEAGKHDVEVNLMSDGYHFIGIHSARMVKCQSSYNKAAQRRWFGFSADHNNENIKFEGSKTKVANWCLDIASNGAP